MKLSELVKGLGYSVIGDGDVDITAISYDSRAVERSGVKTSGALFAAIPGEHVDGTSFIKDAVKRGAVSILTERPDEVVAVPQIVVKDVREALSRLSSILYGEPSKKLYLTGVTGTNGKTTTTYLIESIFKEAALSPGVVGTVNYRHSGKTFEAPHTTPQAPDLQRLLNEMRSSGVTHVVMEVSSHSLVQKRVSSCSFSAAVFTNLTPEHLDYHRTMDAYFRAKAILFERLLKKDGSAVVNVDDEWGRKLLPLSPSTLTYSLGNGADIRPERFRLLEGGIEAAIATPSGRVSISSNLAGEYNLQNILASIGAGVVASLSAGDIERGVNALKSVPGRLEKIESNGAKRLRAYVDYAHTGDALLRALTAVNGISTGRIITVFGCGGNRDRTKRPVMGEIASRFSAVTIVTSDNPRDEDPLSIIEEIETGMKGVSKVERRRFSPPGEAGKCYMVIPERGEAIRKAVEIASDGDTIFVAGKGHENYQIVKGVKTHFDDVEVLREAIREMEASAGV